MEREAIDQMNDIIKSIKRVSFELSNLCNYAAIHPQCPASKVKRPIFLSQRSSRAPPNQLYESFVRRKYQTTDRNQWRVFGSNIVG